MQCTHGLAEMDTACGADGLCPICLQAENKRLKKAVNIAKIKLSVIEIRAKDRRPMGSKGDKPIWITAKNGLKEIEQAL